MLDECNVRIADSLRYMIAELSGHPHPHWWKQLGNHERPGNNKPGNMLTRMTWRAKLAGVSQHRAEAPWHCGLAITRSFYADELPVVEFPRLFVEETRAQGTCDVLVAAAQSGSLSDSDLVAIRTAARAHITKLNAIVRACTIEEGRRAAGRRQARHSLVATR
jgi:hypothetical protein